MKGRFQIVDSDMHVHEPPDLWQRYIDPEFAAVAPVGSAAHPRDLRVKLNGMTFPDNPFSPTAQEFRNKINEKAYADGIARGFDPASQIMAMDNEGLDVAVLYPSRGLFVFGIDGIDPALGAAIARAYNDWLFDFCSISPRFVGAAMVSVLDIDAAAQEVRRAATSLGFKAVFLSPNYVDERRWSDSHYDPLWAECERLGVPVGFHGVGRVDPMLKRFGGNFSISNTLTHPTAIITACVDIIGGGVLERFPRLKIAFLEANCSWLPWMLWRLGEYVEMFGEVEFPQLTMQPIDYFRRQCYASIECDEAPAKCILDYGLEKNIVFSTDYPHSDVKYPHAVDSFLRLPFSDADKHRFLWENCATLYGLSAPKS